MSPAPKSSASNSDPRGVNAYRIAIVGAASLLGKEIAEVLRDRNFPAVDIRLLDDDESLGQLEAVGDEMSFIQSVRAEQFERVDFTFFAGDQRSTKASWQTARDSGSTIIDLSDALEGEPGASVRSPWVEHEIGHPVTPQLQPGPVVVAHPAAIALALLSSRAQKAGKLARVIATVLGPASEYGQKGMDELHEQTVNLLSFQDLPKNVFDVQVAFNVVGQYGSRSQHSLDAMGQRILKHYRILVPDAIEPSLQMLQVPVFHGHAFSIYLEMENEIGIKELSDAMSGDHLVVTSPEEAPNNVNAAGQGDILIALSADAGHKNGIWIWAVIDNLRVAAVNAVECAETMTVSRPRGQIQ